MKHLIIILLMLVATGGQAQQKQSLKDLLFSGKLKKDSSGVVRSTDDLSAKIDTSTKVEAPPAPVTQLPANSAQEVQNTTVRNDGNGIATPNPSPTTDTTATANAPVNRLPARTNTRLWRDYSDSLTKALKADVLNSRQIKKNTYFVTVDYELAPDGQVTVTNISSSPENAFLQAQVRQYMDANPPRLNPTTETGTQVKKLKRKQQFTVTKE